MITAHKHGRAVDVSHWKAEDLNRLAECHGWYIVYEEEDNA